MNRLGFKVPEIIEVINSLKAEGFTCVFAMHFANADVDNHPLNEQQRDQFLHVKQACAPILGSCCNSGPIFKWPELNFDFWSALASCFMVQRLLPTKQFMSLTLNLS